MRTFQIRLTKRAALLSAALAATALLVSYLCVFFQAGALFEGAFLPRGQDADGAVHYKGSAFGAPVSVTVLGNSRTDGAAIVRYATGGRTLAYEVRLEAADALETWRAQILQDGETVFRGVYRPGAQGDAFALVDENHEPDWDALLSFTVNGESPFTADYRPGYLTTVRFADRSIETPRGNPVFLALAVLVLLVTLVDWRFPRLFFALSHALSVRDPQPTDLYLFVQKLSWAALPAFAVILLIAGLFVR